jgi:hypothetical protein
VKQKRDSVFNVINGLKHVLRKLTNEGDQLTCSHPFSTNQDIAEIQFPQIVIIISKISLIVDKKLRFVI